MDYQISVHPEDIAVFRAKMLRYRPRTIAFTSKKAASLFYGRPTQAINFGKQASVDECPDVFVLSSPSGAASGHWTVRPWCELAEWMSAESPPEILRML
jgi:double-stranded uracil-DNA glycosylase